MNSKQLANVLIKMIGLSAIVNGLQMLGFFLQQFTINTSGRWWWSTAVGFLIPIAVGTALIIWSKNIAGVLFKDETI
jgi:hypothetical protein